MVQATLAAGHHALAAAVLAVGFLTLIAMARIWAELFWSPHPAGPAAVGRLPAAMLAPLLALAALIVIVGLNAAPFIDAAIAVGAGLLDPAAYVAAVLEPGR
jgi:multicomponent Na+:H+ antiporter subunit D